MLQENEISELINQSGRLRMLSHRTGMLAVTISKIDTDDSWFLETFQSSMTGFQVGYDSLFERVSYDSEFKFALVEMTKLPLFDDGCTSIDDIVTSYINQLREINDSFHTNTKPSDQTLQDFLKYIAHDLLQALNRLVHFFEVQLNKLTSSKQDEVNKLTKSIGYSLDDVDNINMTVKILSLNASVEASKAGDSGKGFATISSEMSSLSSQIKNVTEYIKRDIKAFIAKLE
jgi:signal transduction histidine kinase